MVADDVMAESDVLAALGGHVVLPEFNCRFVVLLETNRFLDFDPDLFENHDYSDYLVEDVSECSVLHFCRGLGWHARLQLAFVA